MTARSSTGPEAAERGGQVNERTEVAMDGPEQGELRPLISGRRLLRWTAVVGVGVLAVLACWQDPSYANETGPFWLPL
jgi:hypothetical protein